MLQGAQRYTQVLKDLEMYGSVGDKGKWDTGEDIVLTRVRFVRAPFPQIPSVGIF